MNTDYDAPPPMAKISFEDFEPDAQVLAEVEAVARSFCNANPVSSRMCEFQGMYSKSAVVSLSDGTEFVVQLKDNEINTTKTVLANSLLGDVVPTSFGAVSKAKFAYVSRFIPGTVWILREPQLSVQESATIAYQVGVLIAQCRLGIQGSALVDGYVIPRMRRILSKVKMPKKTMTRIEGLLGLTDNLRILPLSLSHIDINVMNIILDTQNNIVGLIDWEMAQLLPLGMNAWCIRYLSVPISGGVDRVEGKSYPMAEAFWKGLFATLPPDLHHVKGTVVDSMLIGLVLFTFAEGVIVQEREVKKLLPRLEWIEEAFRPICTV